MKPGGRLWAAYPKKSSGADSDLHRDVGWATLMDTGYRPVSMFAIDGTWSAIRFRSVADSKPLNVASMRPRGDRPELVVPADLAAILSQNTGAKAIFDKLAYTHRKEYIRWIEEAKRSETRLSRLDKTIGKILQGQTPA